MAEKPTQSKPKSKSKRGGKRAGAGRKPSVAAKARADYTAVTQSLLIDMLPDCLRNLKRLADGGYQRVEETFEPSEGMTIALKPSVGHVKPPAENLVCTKRVVSIAEPDRAANQYLIDRLLGRPTEHKEIKASVDDSRKGYAGFDPELV